MIRFSQFRSWENPVRGSDFRSGVALVEYSYDVPFKFIGKINKPTFKLEPEQDARAKR